MEVSGFVGGDEKGGGTTLAGTLVTTRQARWDCLTPDALK
jgi:hypothetical protein